MIRELFKKLIHDWSYFGRPLHRFVKIMIKFDAKSLHLSSLRCVEWTRQRIHWEESFFFFYISFLKNDIYFTLDWMFQEEFTEKTYTLIEYETRVTPCSKWMKSSNWLKNGCIWNTTPRFGDAVPPLNIRDCMNISLF